MELIDNGFILLPGAMEADSVTSASGRRCSEAMIRRGKGQAVVNQYRAH